jgi:hypothetical protein
VKARAAGLATGEAVGPRRWVRNCQRRPRSRTKEETRKTGLRVVEELR